MNPPDGPSEREKEKRARNPKEREAHHRILVGILGSGVLILKVWICPFRARRMETRRKCE